MSVNRITVFFLDFDRSVRGPYRRPNYRTAPTGTVRLATLAVNGKSERAPLSARAAASSTTAAATCSANGGCTLKLYGTKLSYRVAPA